MHHASPVRWWCSRRMRYITGSRRFWLGDSMSIFARSTCAPSGNSPARMRAKQLEVLVDGAVAVRADAARLVEAAAPRADLLERLAVDVGLARLDELLGDLVELLEVVRREVEAVAPVEAEPAHVVLDRLGRTRRPPSLGFVSSKRRLHAAPGIACGDAEVEADALGVADVQVAVRLGRKARHHLAAVLARRDVRLDELEDEVRQLLRSASPWAGCLARWLVGRSGGEPRALMPERGCSKPRRPRRASSLPRECPRFDACRCRRDSAPDAGAGFSALPRRRSSRSSPSRSCWSSCRRSGGSSATRGRSSTTTRPAGAPSSAAERRDATSARSSRSPCARSS